MPFVEWFWSIMIEAVNFGKFVLSRLFSNSITIGFLPMFIAIIIFGAVVAYVIRPFLVAGSSDLAEKGWNKTYGHAEMMYGRYKFKKWIRSGK